MDLESLRPPKIVAVHLNFRSRAEQRGRFPAHPSYFLKPSSSISRDGAPVVRPRGCELLVLEGEIGVVIGTRARNVTPQEGAAHVGWITAANDFGVYDFRWADRGSNVLAKGQDGFTPVGPRLVPASELDLGALVLRTRVNGETVQEDSSANLIYDFGALIADLSRLMTLEPGDLILTGTPAGSQPVQPATSSRSRSTAWARCATRSPRPRPSSRRTGRCRRSARRCAPTRTTHRSPASTSSLRRRVTR